MECGTLRSCGFGEAGSPAPLAKEGGEAIQRLHKAVSRAEELLATLRAKDLFSKIPAAAAAASAADSRHLPDLDGFLNAEKHGKVVLTAARAELKHWRESWQHQLTKLVDDINDAIPTGWSSHKDDILAVENAAVVQSMLGNAKFQALSSHIAQLGQHFEMLCSIKREAGVAMVPPLVWSACSSALTQGTDTVSITFALYKLRTAIPKLAAGPPQRKAVESLRVEMRKRGVELGASLEAECTRLAQ